jgi:hypothetical protein
MVGMLVNEATKCTSRIRKAARANDVEPQVKVEAERSVWANARDLVGSLQSLGYLPTAAHVFQGQLTHHMDDAPDQQHIEAELNRLEAVIQDSANPQLLEQLSEVKQVVKRVAASERLIHLKTAVAIHDSASEQQA